GGRDEMLDSPADASTSDVDAATPDVDASVPDVDASAPDSGDGATDASVDVSDAGMDADADLDADVDAASDACVGCVCVPGETAECYGGPDSTAGVGICTVGQRTCTEAGQWSECAGEVLPAQEDCGTPL